MNNPCTCSAIVLLQDLLPLMSSKDIRPGTWLTQYYQSWWLGYEITLTAQQNTVGHKKGFPKRPLIFLHPKAWRSLTISQLHGGWFLQKRRPEIKFYTKGSKCTAQPKDGMPISTQTLRHLGSSIMQGFPNVNSVEPPLALQKQRRTVTSQMQLMITTNWQFSWKHNAAKYLWPTRMSNAKWLWLQHKHMSKYML